MIHFAYVFQHILHILHDRFRLQDFHLSPQTEYPSTELRTDGNGDGDFKMFVVHAIDHHIGTKLINDRVHHTVIELHPYHFHFAIVHMKGCEKMSQIIINLPYEDKRKFAEITYKNDITIAPCIRMLVMV